MNASRIALAGGALALLLSASTASADIIVTRDRQNVTRRCTGKTRVRILSNKSHVTLTGRCALVEVSGNKNQVTLQYAAHIRVLGNKIQLTAATAPHTHVAGNKCQVHLGRAGRIQVMGNKNRVTWKKGLGGKRPQISNLGNKNSVTQVR